MIKLYNAILGILNTILPNVYASSTMTLNQFVAYVIILLILWLMILSIFKTFKVGGFKWNK